ncbi:hypothetical protein M0L20_28785 [Spirosoma sp. RP8]|uniref:Uncharacterized protein n=1 Tax=Spirosoma liriopis TaxID=2937440 RepID=A0ABT0HUV9_9BACT|nr:hypothetical protein [Spirosoma liriopis]MCK8495897.1 hypothetical protein [Spirosoma liriopis]
MIRYGICTNTDYNCPNANSGDVIQVDGAQEFICPECKKELFEVSKPPSRYSKWFKPALIVGMLLLLCCLIWAFWPQPSITTVEVKSWDCQTGVLSLTSTGGNGDQITYKVEGINMVKSNNEFIIPNAFRNGKVLSVFAIQNGNRVSNSFTTTCINHTSLNLEAASDCQKRLITLTTTGGNESPITFIAKGLSSGESNNVFIIPKDQPVGSTLTFFAVQNGDTANVQYKIECPQAPQPPGDGGDRKPAALVIKWTRVDNSEFCDPGTCTLLYSETDKLGHTRERRIENYAKCCPANK